MILKQLAQKISDDTAQIIGIPVSISDEKGYLIGVNDRSRLGLFDQLFAEVLETRQITYWDESAVIGLENIYPGVAAPIIVNDEVLGAVGVLGKTGYNPETTSYIKLVKNHIEMLCHEAIKKEVKSLKTSTIDTLIHYILNANHSEEEQAQMIRYGEMLGFDLEIDRMCIIMKINQISRDALDDLNKITPDNTSLFIVENIYHIFKDDAQDLVGRINLNEYIIFKAIHSDSQAERKIKQLEHRIKQFNQQLKTHHHLTATAYIGNVQSSISGLKQSYANALKVLNYMKGSEKDNQIYDFNHLDVRLNILLSDMPETIFLDLIEHFREFMKHENYQMLAETFIAYCHHKYNLSDTSRKLYIHRNTLIYRLKRISELTHIDIDQFEHCLLLYIIIKKHGY